MVIFSATPESTVNIGVAIGRCLMPGWTVALQGDLGTGKTRLTKGIARGVGVGAGIEITSPTFAIMNEYSGRLLFYHMDLYRIAHVDDLLELGYPEGHDSNAVWVIEWADKIKDRLPETTLSIEIKYRTGDLRELLFSGEEALVDAICASLEGD